MAKFKKQLGFTLIEGIIVVAVLSVVLGVGFSGYVVIHFLTKFW